MTKDLTPSQTIGPFFHEAWRWAFDASAPAPVSTAFITIAGKVYDGDGQPINDAVLEAWTPDSAGTEAGRLMPAFRRIPSGEDGTFSLQLSVPSDASSGRPVAFITIFARGLLKHQFTAIFLGDDPELQDSAILNQVPEERRQTLIASKSGPASYQWDMWMQSDKETVFFDYM
jgi:protocatechuate 3,4-dioxygenase alpha subunit